MTPIKEIAIFLGAVVLLIILNISIIIFSHWTGAQAEQVFQAMFGWMWLMYAYERFVK